MLQVVELLRGVNSIQFKDAKAAPNIQTQLDIAVTLSKIEQKNELPPAYLLFLKDVQGQEIDKNIKSKIFLKILRLYIYARSQNRGNPRALKEWLKSGRLPAEDFSSRFGMGLLYKKLQAYSRKFIKYQNLEKEIGKMTSSTNKNSSIEKLRNKENAQDSTEIEMNDSLEEIISILDKIETLIAPRTDK